MQQRTVKLVRYPGNDQLLAAEKSERVMLSA